MRASLVIAAAFVLATADVGIAQEPTGSLQGIVIRPDGVTVAEAPIRVRDETTGTDARTFSLEDGQYRVPNLPNGNFTVTVEMPCCAYAPYTNNEVVLGPGETLELNIQLELGNVEVLADDPGAINAEIRNRQVIPDLPVPRTNSGMPDLSGVWLMRGDPFPDDPPAQPWAQEVLEERLANDFRNHPHTLCLPSNPSIPGSVAPFMAKFVQKNDLLVILFEDVPGFRQVFLDGRDHPEFPNPSWMGHSIGRWEGDSLVVDTVGFNDRGWNFGYPRSEKLHLEERFTRSEYGYMDVRVTIEDPEVFTGPWVRNLRFNLAPQEELLEYVCESNKWAPVVSQQ